MNKETENMKITINPNQIPSGEHLMFVSKKRQTTIENLVARHEPISLSHPVCKSCSIKPELSHLPLRSMGMASIQKTSENRKLI